MICVMNRFILTTEEKASLELLHLQCKDKKDSDRLKAVLLRSEGWTVPKISQALRVHQTTIIRHINEYHDGKLKNESGGSDSKLDTSQTEELTAHLEVVSITMCMKLYYLSKTNEILVSAFQG